MACLAVLGGKAAGARTSFPRMRESDGPGPRKTGPASAVVTGGVPCRSGWKGHNSQRRHSREAGIRKSAAVARTSFPRKRESVG